MSIPFPRTLLIFDILGDLVEGLISAFAQAFFLIFGAIADVIRNTIAGAIAEPLFELLLETPVPKRCPDPDIPGSGGSFADCASPEPALIRTPHNGLWESAYSGYWDTFLPLALILGLVLYVIVNSLSTIPWVSPRYRAELKGGMLKLLVALAFAWPVMTVSLYLMDGVNTLVAPTRPRFTALVSGIITGVVTAAASPAAVLTAILAMINVTLFAALIALLFLRVLALQFIPWIAPILLMGWILKIPVLRGIGKSLLSLWGKFGIAPLVIAAAFKVAAIAATSCTRNADGVITSCSFDPTGGGYVTSSSALFNFAMGLLLPFIGIGGLYFVLQASPGRRVQQGIRSAIRQGPKRGLNEAPGVDSTRERGPTRATYRTGYERSKAGLGAVHDRARQYATKRYADWHAPQGTRGTTLPVPVDDPGPIVPANRPGRTTTEPPRSLPRGSNPPESRPALPPGRMPIDQRLADIHAATDGGDKRTVQHHSPESRVRTSTGQRSSHAQMRDRETDTNTEDPEQATGPNSLSIEEADQEATGAIDPSDHNAPGELDQPTEERTTPQDEENADETEIESPSDNADQSQGDLPEEWLESDDDTDETD